MKKSEQPYERHLAFRELPIPAGGEWTMRLTGWSVIQVRNGTGYYLQPQMNQELEAGSVLLIAGGAKGIIRASQLGNLTLFAFSVMPSRLTGLMTLTEQSILAKVASKKEEAVKIILPGSPAAMKLEQLHTSQKRAGLSFRLQLLSVFVEIVGHELEQETPADETPCAKTRLQSFLNETPSSELLEIDFNDLARRLHCTSRHLGRIFHQLVGMSFRDKRAAIRLERARELLATTNSKLVDVALESGFKSLSLFNLMFARHFGSSPGKWRQNQEWILQNADNIKLKIKMTRPPGNPAARSLQIDSHKLSRRMANKSWVKHTGTRVTS